MADQAANRTGAALEHAPRQSQETKKASWTPQDKLRRRGGRRAAFRGGIGELLRKERLHSAQLEEWRRATLTTLAGSASCGGCASSIVPFAPMRSLPASPFAASRLLPWTSHDPLGSSGGESKQRSKMQAHEQRVSFPARRASHGGLTALVVLVVVASACGGRKGNSGNPPPPPPKPPEVQLSSLSPAENPIDGLGVTLTVHGSNFDNSAEVWLDRGRINARRLTTTLVDSSTLAALAPRSVWTGTGFGNALVSVLQGGVTSSQTLVLNYYAPCGTGAETGPYGTFTGNSNGSAVLDANSDVLRFRAYTRQLVIDGVLLNNTLFDPSNGNVTIDGVAVARIYSAPGSSGQPIAVIGTLDGQYLRDQTRGAVELPSQRNCSAWVLRTTPFRVPTFAALGTTLGEGPGGAGRLELAACPAVEITSYEAGRLSIHYSNLVPGHLYLSSLSFADPTAQVDSGEGAFIDFARMQSTERTVAVVSPFVADSPDRCTTFDPPWSGAISVNVIDASGGLPGCGAFASSADPLLGNVGATAATSAEMAVVNNADDR